MRVRKNTSRTARDLANGNAAVKTVYQRDGVKTYVIGVDREGEWPGQTAKARYLVELTPQELYGLILMQSASEMIDELGIDKAKEFIATLEKVLNLPLD